MESINFAENVHFLEYLLEEINQHLGKQHIGIISNQEIF